METQASQAQKVQANPAPVLQAQVQAMQAQLAQATPSAQPPQVPPPFMLDNNVIDFSEVGAKKHYHKTIAPFIETLDGSHEKFVAILSGVSERVHHVGWKQIMLINVALSTYNLLVDY